MKFGVFQSGRVLALLALIGFVMSGCGQSENKDGQAKPKGDKDKGTQVADAKKNDKKGDHGGWWCREHGIPEKDCSMCLPEAEVKKRFKDKGDWCKEHDRALSQCFICKPERKDFFAAQYRAKYGKEPP